MSNRKLRRSQSDCVLFGVAGGIAEYLSMDPVIVRLAFIVLALIDFWGVILYLLLVVLMPKEHVAARANGFDSEEILVKDAS
ncbi:MAG: PspC domain-containing protein [Candidatus Promineifilaceae bacterium]